MLAARKRFIAAIASLAGVALIGATAYLLNLPPFEQKSDTIESRDVCESMGRSAVPALRQVLPSEASYSFEETPGTRVGDDDSSYTSACFVSAEDKIILSARTEMMLAEPSKDWVEDEVLSETRNAQDLKPFTAGAGGVASGRMAAVLVPCTPAGQIPGGSYSLSVIVKLKEIGESDQREARESLIDLAIGTAKFSQQKARCELPAKLPVAS
ncbi:hypothetical protein ACGFSB_30685 [Streptomyces sp. NPDC048441]|uniref:hypothetical protein n=1 Tax=Streptomyces sp. NPDC048441 TaxID=3365552 RepID=UPI0037106C6F